MHLSDKLIYIMNYFEYLKHMIMMISSQSFGTSNNNLGERCGSVRFQVPSVKQSSGIPDNQVDHLDFTWMAFCFFHLQRPNIYGRNYFSHSAVEDHAEQA